MISNKQGQAECRRLIDSGGLEWLEDRLVGIAFSQFQLAEAPDEAWNAHLFHRAVTDLIEVIEREAPQEK